jgi:hypothetical protein
MTTTQRLARDLPDILDELAAGPYPDYIDDVLAISAVRRQRPRWTFPERWLPMADVASRPALAPRLPWRTIAVALLILALIVGAAIAYVGAQRRLPPAFGLAANGLIAYAAGGDIHTVDPQTGIDHIVISGAEDDTNPIWSLDGSQFVFERKESGATGAGRLMVAGADGDPVTVVTPEPLLQLAPTFSPNGVELLIEAYVDGEHALFIANADGRAMRRLDVGMDATWASYRPPDGRQVLFLGTEGPTGSTGIFVVDVASGNVQTVIEPDPSREFAYPAFSPDGSMITYTVESGPEVHVAMADGSGDRVLDLDPDSTFSAGTWSNEGTRIFACAFAKTGRDTDYVAVVAEVNTPGRLVHLRRPANATWACAARWAPDDTAILAIPGSASNQVLPPMLWDPLTGAARPVPRDADGTWQRVAP